MQEKSVKNLKTNQTITMVISFVFVAILTVILTTSLTLAAFGSTDSSGESTIFGTIVLDDISQNFTIKNSLDQTLSSVAPGDDAKVNFTVQNNGTADMFVRFKLVLEDTDTVTPLDMNIFTTTLESAKYTKLVEGVPTEFNAEYIPYDFGNGDIWYVRRLAMIGNLNMLTNDPPDSIRLNIAFNGEEMTNDYKNANIGVNLYVETVQVANNGYQRDVTLPGYDVVWSN